MDCTTSIAEWKRIGLHVMIPITATSEGLASHGGDAVSYSFCVARLLCSAAATPEHIGMDQHRSAPLIRVGCL